MGQRANAAPWCTYTDHDEVATVFRGKFSDPLRWPAWFNTKLRFEAEAGMKRKHLPHPPNGKIHVSFEIHCTGICMLQNVKQVQVCVAVLGERTRIRQSRLWFVIAACGETHLVELRNRVVAWRNMRPDGQYSDR